MLHVVHSLIFTDETIHFIWYVSDKDKVINQEGKHSSLPHCRKENENHPWVLSCMTCPALLGDTAMSHTALNRTPPEPGRIATSIGTECICWPVGTSLLRPPHFDFTPPSTLRIRSFLGHPGSFCGGGLFFTCGCPAPLLQWPCSGTSHSPRALAKPWTPRGSTIQGYTP